MLTSQNILRRIRGVDVIVRGRPFKRAENSTHQEVFVSDKSVLDETPTLWRELLRQRVIVVSTPTTVRGKGEKEKKRGIQIPWILVNRFRGSGYT